MSLADEITVDIKEHIGVLRKHETGWTREVNIVSWNGGEPKLDIREWSPDHERMSRGLTFTEEETAVLTKLLMEREQIHSRAEHRKVEEEFEM